MTNGFNPFDLVRPGHLLYPETVPLYPKVLDDIISAYDSNHHPRFRRAVVRAKMNAWRIDKSMNAWIYSTDNPYKRSDFRIVWDEVVELVNTFKQENPDVHSPRFTSEEVARITQIARE